jgi:hypothetical protein
MNEYTTKITQWNGVCETQLLRVLDLSVISKFRTELNLFPLSRNTVGMHLLSAV